MAQGYIKLYRQLQQHPFWQEPRTYSKAEAWIDLLFMANHKDNKFLLGNDLIVIERGSFITSELKLMARWKWSKSKTRAFLDLLQNEQMIVKKTDHKKTAITIVNYGIYQDIQTIKEPQKDRQQTASRPQKDTNNNEKNVKNVKNDNSTPYNPPKEKPVKIAVSEFVNLTPDEHERLIAEYGEPDTSRMIEILDNYIGSNPEKNGKRYTDHNRVIRGWVKDRLAEEKAKKVVQGNFKENKADLIDKYLGLEA